jgi:uncharacterized protein (TIGR03118 family)
MNALKKVLKLRAALALLLSFFPSVAFAQHYTETDLVSSIAGVGKNATNPLDTQLINAWGLTRSAASPWWVSDNGTGLSTLYDGAGTKQGLVVTIPVPSGGNPPSTPTGVVFNGTPDFPLPASTAAKFIFVTENGTIAAWNGGTTAVIVKDNSKKGAIYKGCTIAEWNGKHYLYVANFHSGEIEVYDSTFTRVSLRKHAFTEDGDDDDNDNFFDFDHDGRGGSFNEHRHNFAPFNVQAIGTNVYVAYAKQDAEKKDEVAGAGLGFVDVFNPGGQRLARLQHGAWFNAPWGLALAPGEFGEFSHSVLVGMFGSGQIAAFNPVNGAFIGLMKKPDNSILSIDGLWALGFGAGNANSGPYNALYFTAGPNDENDGTFGNLVPIPTELAEVDEP